MSMPASIITSFMRIHSILTTLHLSFLQKHIKTITLAEILYYVGKNLEELVYTTKSPLASVLGDFYVVPEHHILRDVQLETQSLTRHSLEPLIKGCPQLRRPALCGCTGTLLDVIKTCCPRLEILGYNSNKVESLDHLPVRPNSNVSGLRALYTATETDAISLDSLSELLIENMETLETMFANVVPDESRVDLFSVPLDNLKLSNLKKLRYWSGSGGRRIEQDILKSISTCTSLTHVEARYVSMVSELLDRLLMMPPVKTFGLSFTEEEDLAGGSLISLFRKYAALPLGQSKLQVVCKSVPNTVPSTLARIPMQKILHCTNWIIFTDRAINDFF